tara:strand:- start:111 stop:416 length:306 start_codon:yes stop_codon:yes gene_type:complete
MRSILVLPFLIAGIFAATMHLAAEVTVSNIFGWLGFSIATGSIGYFMIFAPYGLRTHTTVFGRRQKYRHPVAEIPPKVAGVILFFVALCLGISFGCFTYGI